MSESVFEISMVSGTQCKDGRHFQELVCVGENNHIIRVLLPVSNPCENMPFGESRRCLECEYKETCEIMSPCEVEIGRRLVIVDKGEIAK